MKNISIIVLALVIIIFGCEKNLDDNKLKGTNNENIIPLAVGNTWNYISNYKGKNDNCDIQWNLLITQKKSIPVFFPDSSVKISDVYITRTIATSGNGTHIDTTFHGYIKYKDGIALVEKCDSNPAIYIRKYLNYFKIGWFDTLAYNPLTCSESNTIKTTAGTFACIRYSGRLGSNTFCYYCKGVGLISEIVGLDKIWTSTLVSYKLK